jgi:hypothetical protein
MKSSSLRLRLIALPLVSLALSGALIMQQTARRNRLAGELKEAQTEYARLERTLKKVPASASAMMAESHPHVHSDAEEAAEHAHR